MTFEFDRYINGQLMAEGVTIERQGNLPDAMREAARIASRGPNGEVPVLVLRAESLSRTGAVKVKAWKAEADRDALIEEAKDFSERMTSQPWACELIDRLIAALEPAAPEGQQPVADALELSGNTGELIDRMAAAIRDWGSHYDDGPWETLPEDRKAGWRGDAERALAVVKEYLTARRPSEQAVTEAARAVCDNAKLVDIGKNGAFNYVVSPYLIDALKAAMEAGRHE